MVKLFVVAHLYGLDVQLFDGRHKIVICLYIFIGERDGARQKLARAAHDPAVLLDQSEAVRGHGDR